MNLFWKYDFERTFPFVIIDYTYDLMQGKAHLHDYLEIVLCTEGTGDFVFPNKTLKIEKNDIFFISRFYNHVAISNSEKPLKLVLVLFLPELIDTVWMKNNDKAYLELFWDDMGREILKVDPNAQCLERFRNIILEMQDIWERRPIAYQLLLEGKLKVLLAHALEYYKTLNPNKRIVNTKLKVKLQPAIDYIDLHSHEKISLKDVCPLVHLSESQFRHNFKLATNMTFVEYVNYIRIIKVINLLVSSDDSINDIVGQAGFTNISQFYSLFKKYTGMTPVQYKKINLRLL